MGVLADKIPCRLAARLRPCGLRPRPGEYAAVWPLLRSFEVEGPAEGDGGMMLSDRRMYDSPTDRPACGIGIPFEDAHISAEGRDDGGKDASFACGESVEGCEGKGRAEVIRE